MTTWTPKRHTAMHYQHLQHGATLFNEDDWELVAYYSSVESEKNVRNKGVGISDISHIGKLYLQGKNLTKDISRIIGLQTPDNHKMLRSTIKLNKETNIAVNFCKLGEDEAFITCDGHHLNHIASFITKESGGTIDVVDMSSNFAGIRIIGPLSSTLLSKLTDLDIRESKFPNYSCAQVMSSEIYSIMIHNNIGNISSFEIYVTRDFGVYTWDAILDAGEELNIAQIGIESLRQIIDGA